ncbi:hypothetical protein Lesp02_84140 [Lentzea sp. NBRC 105346]|uniref:hypothetical protein n=1 Tax=Lentzea sp. NBRC 105346 TaxID=3032205 RepID=UPI0024A512D0|nr:hypothetical protein [Lentzea sp. NBRC 105346]GLZ36227.1 hypothetical protein Lesp02_84140 [Lentzea sp. NBRC 105346]
MEIRKLNPYEPTSRAEAQEFARQLRQLADEVEATPPFSAEIKTAVTGGIGRTPEFDNPDLRRRADTMVHIQWWP